MNIRQYNEGDFLIIQKLMEDLQDYLVNIDPRKRTIRKEGYGESYTRRFFQRVKENEGVIYLLEEDHKIIGLIGGLIAKQTPEDLLECVPTKNGRVIELIVEKKYRGQNYGILLMNKMEEYFIEKNCTAFQVEVFEPNKNAHNFYKKCGYVDRMIDMIKINEKESKN